MTKHDGRPEGDDAQAPGFSGGHYGGFANEGVPEGQPDDGEVTLTGTVNSPAEKRAVEEAVEQAPGVREVQNRLRVNRGANPSRDAK